MSCHIWDKRWSSFYLCTWGQMAMTTLCTSFNCLMYCALSYLYDPVYCIRRFAFIWTVAVKPNESLNCWRTSTIFRRLLKYFIYSTSSWLLSFKYVFFFNWQLYHGLQYNTIVATYGLSTYIFCAYDVFNILLYYVATNLKYA